MKTPPYDAHVWTPEPKKKLPPPSEELLSLAREFEEIGSKYLDLAESIRREDEEIRS